MPLDPLSIYLAAKQKRDMLNSIREDAKEIRRLQDELAPLIKERAAQEKYQRTHGDGWVITE